ncbi:MAG: thioredoxin domain-containing protein [Deltaproteobacteria bacterium]|nr:thioredoxin domain-containing protein [Deltaproteobacteria bacterium]
MSAEDAAAKLDNDRAPEAEARGEQPARWLVACLLASLVGMGAAADLSVLHWQVHNVPGHVSFCAINDTVNCDTVAMSKYSMLLGMPISTWAVLFFGLLTALSIWGLADRRSAWPWGLLAPLNAVAVGLSAMLFLISEAVIHAYCIMCITLYTINAVTAVFCVLGQRRAGLPARAGASLVLLALLAATGLFAAFFTSCTAVSPWPVLVLGAAGLAGLAAVNLPPSTGLGSLGRLGRALGADLGRIFRRPALGAGLIVLAACVLVAALIVSPLLYEKEPRVGSTCDESAAQLIAGGIEAIGHGQTPEGWHWIGAEHPEVVAVEYSDYECPYCRKAHEIVRRVVRENKDWLRLIHVQMPLDQACNPALKRPFHRHACDCALGAICAAEQGAFWPMNDRLFLRRGGLGPDGLAELAAEMGLDEAAFRDCMQSDAARARLQADLAECARLKLRPATPTFRVGGRMVRGLKDAAWWRRAVQYFREQRRRPRGERG